MVAPRPIFQKLGVWHQAPKLIGHFSSVSKNRGPASDSLLRQRTLQSEADHSAARNWLDGFEVNDIPKESWEAGYSRSSGPGGQHVNKTNSKATIRCDLSKASGTWLPPFLIPPLSKSPHYLPSPPSLLISSQTTRTASSNLSTAIATMHQTILAAGRSVIIGETSVGQKERVKGLERAEKARKRGEKDRRSAKKSARKDMG